jgi:hypothetical protein
VLRLYQVAKEDETSKDGVLSRGQSSWDKDKGIKQSVVESKIVQMVEGEERGIQDMVYCLLRSQRTRLVWILSLSWGTLSNNKRQYIRIQAKGIPTLPVLEKS